jgi:hypothetical protein
MYKYKKWIYLCVIFFGVSIISGCLEKLYHPEIEVVEGKFVTPKGTFPISTFANTDVESLPYAFATKTEKYTKHIYMLGNDGSTYITLGVLDQYKNIGIVSEKIRPYSFTVGNASYGATTRHVTMDGEANEFVFVEKITL